MRRTHAAAFGPAPSLAAKARKRVQFIEPSSDLFVPPTLPANVRRVLNGPTHAATLVLNIVVVGAGGVEKQRTLACSVPAGFFGLHEWRLLHRFAHSVIRWSHTIGDPYERALGRLLFSSNIWDDYVAVRNMTQDERAFLGYEPLASCDADSDDEQSERPSSDRDGEIETRQVRSLHLEDMLVGDSEDDYSPGHRAVHSQGGRLFSFTALVPAEAALVPAGSEQM